MIEFRDALNLSAEDLGATMTRCFEDYVVPMNITPPLAASLLRTDAIDLASTVVAVDGGEIAGILLVSRRGKIMRVAAMAVAKSHRSQGVGGELMTRALAAAKERGEDRAVLEAIEHNTRAIAFYEKHGFKVRFRLISSQKKLQATSDAPQMVEIGLDELALRVMNRGEAAASWTMSGAEVAQMSLPTVAYDSDGLAAAVSAQGEDSLLCRSMALSGEDDGAKLTRLLAGLATLYPDRTFKVLPFFPEPEFGALYDAAGMERQNISQVQMELGLRS